MVTVTDDHFLAVKNMLIDQLRLRMEPSEIANDSPFFGEGLGLDSVDAIELVAAVEQTFGVVIGNEEEAQVVLKDLGTLTRHIVASGGMSADAEASAEA